MRQLPQPRLPAQDRETASIRYTFAGPLSLGALVPLPRAPYRVSRTTNHPCPWWPPIPDEPAGPPPRCRARPHAQAPTASPRFESCSPRRVDATRSWFLTGEPEAERQPFRFQRTIQRVMPCLRYWESVRRVTRESRRHRFERLHCGGQLHAIVRRQLFAPDTSSSGNRPAFRTSAPHPPGPGLPRQAPSV